MAYGPSDGMLIDVMIGYEALSFVDGNLGYHQIKKHPEDKKTIAFRSRRPKERKCYLPTSNDYHLQRNAGHSGVIRNRSESQACQRGGSFDTIFGQL